MKPSTHTVDCSKHISYREAVGSLIFAAVVSRPDIAYAVGEVSRFLNCYDQTHWNAVKRIFKYLLGSMNYSIVYKGTSSSELIGYADADYARDINTRHSTSGYVFLMNGGAVTWSSQRQKSVSLSTTEAEYVAASSAVKEMMWIRQLLDDIGSSSLNPTELKLDNQGAIKLIKNPEYHKRTKHIDVKYHFIREKYDEGVVKPMYVSSELQLADLFTKPLPKPRFQKLLDQLN